MESKAFQDTEQTVETLIFMGFLNTVPRVFPSPRDCFFYLQEVSLELSLDIPSAWIGHWCPAAS